MTSCTNTLNLINLGADEALHGAFVDLERPIGRKAEKDKQRRKEKTKLDIVLILNEMKEDEKKKTKLNQ